MRPRWRWALILVVALITATGGQYWADGQQRHQPRLRLVPGSVKSKPLARDQARSYVETRRHIDFAFADSLNRKLDAIRAKGHVLSDEVIVVRFTHKFVGTADSAHPLAAALSRFLELPVQAQSYSDGAGEVVFWPYDNGNPSTAAFLSYATQFETGVAVWMDAQVDTATGEPFVFNAEVTPASPDPSYAPSAFGITSALPGPVTVVYANGDRYWKGVKCTDRESVDRKMRETGGDAMRNGWIAAGAAAYPCVGATIGWVFCVLGAWDSAFFATLAYDMADYFFACVCCRIQ